MTRSIRLSRDRPGEVSTTREKEARLATAASPVRSTGQPCPADQVDRRVSEQFAKPAQPNRFAREKGLTTNRVDGRAPPGCRGIDPVEDCGPWMQPQQCQHVGRRHRQGDARAVASSGRAGGRWHRWHHWDPRAASSRESGGSGRGGGVGRHPQEDCAAGGGISARGHARARARAECQVALWVGASPATHAPGHAFVFVT